MEWRNQNTFKLLETHAPVRISHDDTHALPGAGEVQYPQHLVPLVHEVVTAGSDAEDEQK